MQIVALTQALLTHTIDSLVETVLVLSPVSTLLNWEREFQKWLIHCSSKTKIRIRNLLK